MLGALDGQPVDGVVVDHVGDAVEGPAARGGDTSVKTKEFFKGKVVYDFKWIPSSQTYFWDPDD